MAIQLADQDIRHRAYALWEARGCPEGSAEEDWHAAEQQLRAELDSASPLPPLADEAAERLEDEPATVIAARPPPRSRPRRASVMALKG